MSEWKRPERIAGLIAVAIAVLAVITPLVAPPPAPLPHILPHGGTWPTVPSTGNKTATYPAVPTVQVSAANSVVVLDEAPQDNITVSAVGLHSAYVEDGVLHIEANGGVVRIRIPHTIRDVQLKLVNSKAAVATNATLHVKAVNSRFTVVLAATGNRSSSMKLLNSYVTLVVKHAGSGVRLKLSSMGGVITVEGDYSYQLTMGTAELGSGPYLLTVDASNSHVTVRVRGQ